MEEESKTLNNNETNNGINKTTEETKIENSIDGGDNNVLSDRDEVVNVQDILNESLGIYGSYINYFRAIPDLTDGLIPVTRRIIWAMSQLNLTPKSKHLKSARLDGEVIGKYHPHGGCYGTFASMSQEFNYRYPLIDGQGNFGSIDNFEGIAAPRYTEVRPSKMYNLLIKDIEKLDENNFIENYDGTLKEPKLLPAKIPFIFLNDTTGIGLGTSAKTFSFNLTEIIDSLILKTKDINANLSETLKGPDYAIGGNIIINREEWGKIINTGNGSIQFFSDIEVKEIKKTKKKYIVIRNLSPGTSTESFLEKLKIMVLNKKIPEIIDVKDITSDNMKLEINIFIKSGVNPHVVISKLYKYTNLKQKMNGRYVVLNKGKNPSMRSFNTIFSEFIEWRKNIVYQIINYDLRKLNRQKLIIDSKIVAGNNIDKVIKIIIDSESDNDSIEKLKKEFNINNEQGEIIINLQLKSLKRVNIGDLNESLKEIKNQIKGKEEIISSDENIKKYMIDEWEEIKKEYGDERRTKIVYSDSSEANITDIDEGDLEHDNPIKIYLTTDGYLKKDDNMNIKVQRKGGIGKKGKINTKEDEFLKKTLITTNKKNIGLVTESGRIYYVKGYKIPINKKGMPLSSIIEKNINEKIVSIFVSEDIEDQEVLILYTNGKGLISSGKNFKCRNGKKLFKGKVNTIEIIGDNKYLITGKNSGYANRVDLSKIRKLNKIGKGVKIVKVSSIEKNFKDLKGNKKTITIDEKVISAELVKEDDKVLIISKKGYGKITDIKSIRETNRGSKGVNVGMKREDELVFIGRIDIKEKEDLKRNLINFVTKGNLNIYIRAKEVKQGKRTNKGIKVLNLKPGDSIINVSIVNERDLEENNDN